MVSSEVERFLDTEEVRSSILLSPITKKGLAFGAGLSFMSGHVKISPFPPRPLSALAFRRVDPSATPPSFGHLPFRRVVDPSALQAPPLSQGRQEPRRESLVPPAKGGGSDSGRGVVFAVGFEGEYGG